MGGEPTPTDRELEILKILWRRGEATVREVYHEISRELPIVQNTVQAFLRTMEEKGLVEHRVERRSFIYRPLVGRDTTAGRLVSGLLDRVFDGATDQMVQSVLSLQKPTPEELAKIEQMIVAARSSTKSQTKK